MIPAPSIPNNSQKPIDENGFFVTTWFTYLQGILRAIQRSVGEFNVSVASDFPILKNVQTGLTQGLILASVTDNDPTRTNTGQSFAVGDYIVWNGTNWTNVGGGSAGSGTVTSVSVVSANGLAGSVANPTSTPAITLSTTITGALKGNGTAISAAYQVSAKTNGSGSPYSITTDDNTTLFTNEGAAAEVYLNLPTAAANLNFSAYCQNSNGIRFVASAGDTLRLGSTTSSVAGYASSTTTGSFITFNSINATEWIATSSIGTWILA
jgi:hypothetical protein